MTNEQVLTVAINIGKLLLISGAEISRVEDTIRRICDAYGMKENHVFSIASSIIVTIETPEGEWLTQTRRISRYGTDMKRLDMLNNLSRHICAYKPTYEVINCEYEKIENCPEYSPIVLCGVCAMIAMAFTIFFGGTLRDGAAALFCGALLKITLYGLSSLKLNQIFSNVICSMVTGVVCIFVCMIGLGQHVDKIMIGNIMLLIPGVLLTNSFRDFISGDMITGLLHLSEALINAVCVAVGFIIASFLLGGFL